MPVEVETAIPFAEDTQHGSYDPEAVMWWWRIVLSCDRVLKRFRSVGFWPGGGAIAEPAFYAYAYPEPSGYSDRRV